MRSTNMSRHAWRTGPSAPGPDEDTALIVDRPHVTGAAFALGTYCVMSFGAMFFGVVSAAAENEPITIGALLPLTGDAAHWGIPPRDAAELAIDEINNAGG